MHAHVLLIPFLTYGHLKFCPLERCHFFPLQMRAGFSSDVWDQKIWEGNLESGCNYESMLDRDSGPGRVIKRRDVMDRERAWDWRPRSRWKQRLQRGCLNEQAGTRGCWSQHTLHGLSLITDGVEHLFILQKLITKLLKQQKNLKGKDQQAIS